MHVIKSGLDFEPKSLPDMNIENSYIPENIQTGDQVARAKNPMPILRASHEHFWLLPHVDQPVSEKQLMIGEASQLDCSKIQLNFNACVYIMYLRIPNIMQIFQR